MREQVIEALTGAVVAGDAGVAYEGLAQVEWLRRGGARRLLARTLTDAEHRAAQAGQGGDAEAVRHVLRVASLHLRGVDADFGDREATRVAYEGSAPPAPRRRFPVATLAAACALLAAAGGAAWQATRPAPPPPPPPPAPVAAPAGPSRDFSKPVTRRAMPAPSATAFETGGVPRTDPRLSKAFATTFPKLVVATDAVAHGAKEYADQRVALDAELRDPALLALLGERAAARFTDILDMLGEAVRTKPKGERLVNYVMRLHDACGLLDDELARAGLGYFLDSDVWSGEKAGHAVFYLYQVEEVRFVPGPVTPTRVLVVRRIDRLNVSRTELGMQVDYLRDPLVLRQPLEAYAVTKILPAIDADKPLRSGDDAWEGEPDARALAKLAGQVIRQTLTAPLGDEVLRARVVGSLLADRERVVREWRAQAAGRVSFVEIDTPLVDNEIFDALRGVVDESSLAYGGKLDVKLSEMDVEGVVALVADVLTPSVARHEAQHARDEARETPLRLPPPLAPLLGPEESARVEVPGALAWHIRNEMSGYLAQIASNATMARVDLVLLAGWAFDRRAWGGAESYVAAYAIAQIAAELGAPLDAPPIAEGEIDRARLARAMLGILAKSDAEVAAAAGKAWASYFGEPLVGMK